MSSRLEPLAEKLTRGPSGLRVPRLFSAKLFPDRLHVESTTRAAETMIPTATSKSSCSIAWTSVAS